MAEQQIYMYLITHIVAIDTVKRIGKKQMELLVKKSVAHSERCDNNES